MSSPAGGMPDFTKIPAGPHPPGVEPNFVNPESRAPALVGVCILMIILTLPCVALRFFVRLRLTKNPGWDDWVGLIGAIFTLAFTCYAIVVFSLPGNGPHIWDVPLSVYVDPNSTYFLRMLFTQILYPVSAFIIKLSMFLFYARLFVTPSGGKAKYFIYGGATIMALFYTTLVTMTIAYCAPNPSLINPEDACVAKGGQVSWALSGVNIFSDFYILAIPLFIISGLNMNSRKKWAIGTVFLLGLFATIASILTLYFRIVMANGNDIPWDIVPSAISTILELNLGVICSCLPALNALIQKKPSMSQNGTSASSRILSRFTGRRPHQPLSESPDESNNPKRYYGVSSKSDHDNYSAKLVGPDQYTVELGSRTRREAYE